MLLHLLWVSLCWLSYFSQAKWERKEISCFCSGGLEMGPIGAGRRVSHLAVPRASALAGVVPKPQLGMGGSAFPSNPPRLQITS